MSSRKDKIIMAVIVIVFIVIGFVIVTTSNTEYAKRDKAYTDECTSKGGIVLRGSGMLPTCVKTLIERPYGQ